MRTRVLATRAVLAAWMAAAPGCATGTGQETLRCGPGTTEQDGFCVAWGPEDDGAPADEPAADPAAEPDAAAPAPVPPPEEAALDACGPCNVDDDCTESCPGTHCARVNGHRRCVGDDGLLPNPDPAPADGAACNAPCDPLAQCGCDAGLGCAFDVAGALRCVETGSAQQGESCAVDRCAPGATCLADRTCATYCDDEHPCPAGSACIVELQDWQGQTFARACR